MKSPTDLIRQEADLIEAGMKLQEQGLDLLMVEMNALAAMIPGTGAVHTTKSEAETEAETEAGFDNMPV